MNATLDGRFAFAPSRPMEAPTNAAVLTAIDDEMDRRRAQQRVRERLSRQRRLEKIDKVRADVKTMEQLVVALPLVHDVDQVWDEFLDDDVKRVRSLLRRLIPATDTIRKLTDQNDQLQALLAEHTLAMRAVRTTLHDLKNDVKVDDWALNVQRWKALAQLDAALQETHQFNLSTNKQSTDLTFMGWEDRLRLYRDNTALQFSFFKTFHSHDVAQHIDFVNRTHTQTDLYHRVVLGGRGQCAVDVLHQISPYAAIVVYHEKYDGADYPIHAINLVADVETEDGTIQFMRSIEELDVMRAVQDPTDIWINKSYWMQHDLLDPKQPLSSCDNCASVRGTLHGNDPAFLRLWLFEMLCTLIRADNVLSGSSLTCE